MAEKWDLRKAALWGAFFGALNVFVRLFIMGDPMLSGPERFLGNLVGGVIGGVFLFVVVAAIRNFFVRGNSN